MTGAAGGGGPKSMHGSRATGTFGNPRVLKFFEVDNIAIKKIRFTWMGGTF